MNFSHPKRVAVVDVSARDGLQSQAAVLSPEARAEWIRRILAAGLPEAEAGSFVDPRRVPQMAHTADVVSRLGPYRDRLWVLVPNMRGLEAAANAGVRNIVCLVSATETHSRANLGRPLERVLTDLEELSQRIDADGFRARVAVSMAWVDPEEGEVPAETVLGICGALRHMGFRELTLCDTYGGASPRAVAELLDSLFELYGPDDIGLHLHDTFGVASANTLVGLLKGVARFDASVGGLGGCPFAPGARGNMDTEHLVHLLHSLDVETGIDAGALARAAEGCLEMLRRAEKGSESSWDQGPCD